MRDGGTLRKKGATQWPRPPNILILIAGTVHDAEMRRRGQKNGGQKNEQQVRGGNQVPVSIHAQTRKLSQNDFAAVAYEVMGHRPICAEWRIICSAS